MMTGLLFKNGFWIACVELYPNGWKITLHTPTKDQTILHTYTCTHTHTDAFTSFLSLASFGNLKEHGHGPSPAINKVI